MPLRNRVILVLHPEPRVHATVAEAAGEASLVTTVDDWPGLEEALLASPPSTVAVVDPYLGGTGPGPARELHGLLQRLPSTSVIPVLEVTAERAPDVTLLDEWGVAAIISSGHDDTPAAISRRLDDACVRPLKRLLASMLPPETSPHAYTLLFAAADTMCAGGNAADLATALEASPSTLLRWCEAAALPSPRTLLQWVRILLAASLLEEPVRTPDSVARTCGYASTAELRTVTQRLLGRTPAQLKTDGFPHAAARFLQALATLP
jgi:AraC-like DNA-binding protein